MELRELVEVEARAAQRSRPQLSDDAVAEALRAAAALVRGRRAAVLNANRADREAAAGRLDDGAGDNGGTRSDRRSSLPSPAFP